MHELEVMVDPTTGQVVRIASPPVPEFASRVDIDADLARWGHAIVGVPDRQPPAITFLEALQAAHEGIGGGIPEAKQIEGLYVLYQWSPDVLSSGERPPCSEQACPRWLVTVRGLRNVEPHAERPYITWRHEIDAVTGDWLGAVSVP